MAGFLHFSLMDFLDVLVVALVLFLLFRWIKGSSARNAFLAIFIILLVRVMAAAFGMQMTARLLDTVIDVGAIALIVIFQPEVRRFLNNLGRGAGSKIGKDGIIQKLFVSNKKLETDDLSVDEIAEACRTMGAQKTGALIVIRRSNALDEVTSTGDIIDAVINRRLILNIFFKNSPLHDGAMVIGSDRIMAARCTLPITDRSDIPAHFGMRHKAALGVCEKYDVDVIVVSEETGNISFVRGPQLTRVESMSQLKLLLTGQPR